MTMKTGYIITTPTLAKIVGEYLRKEGFTTSGMTLRFTSTSLVVAGISKIETSKQDEDEQDEDEQDEDEQDEDEQDEDEQDEVVQRCILTAIEVTPRSIRDLATTLDYSVSTVSYALSELAGDGKVAKVAAAREDGKTVPLFMKTESDEFDTFVAHEKARVACEIEVWGPKILAVAPQDSEDGRSRMDLIEEVCADVDQATAEHLRADCRNLFYGMLERKMLYRGRDGWKMARSSESASDESASLSA